MHRFVHVRIGGPHAFTQPDVAQEANWLVIQTQRILQLCELRLVQACTLAVELVVFAPMVCSGRTIE